VKLALESSAPGTPVVAPLVSLFVARLLPLPPPFAALLAPLAIGFAPRRVIRIVRAIAAPTVAAFCWRLCRFVSSAGKSSPMPTPIFVMF
jgi:hypothetical protein